MKEYHYNQSLADKLTILLPLKGRPLFTLRYFLYMEEVQCPFKIFIADGSLNEENKNIIDENKHRSRMLILNIIASRLIIQFWILRKKWLVL